MVLFERDEINKMMAEAAVMMTLENRELFKRGFLSGYSTIQQHASKKTMDSDTYRQIISLCRDMPNWNPNMNNWSRSVGVLAGIMKFFPLMIINQDQPEFYLNIIKDLYFKKRIVGPEKAKKLLRTLILAWQKRVKKAVSIDAYMHGNYMKFLAGLPNS